MATTVITTQKVENFAKWKLGFNSREEIRTHAGITIKGVYQSVDDENLVTIISEVPSVVVAKTIFMSIGMKESMEKIGVISTPDIKILIEAI